MLDLTFLSEVMDDQDPRVPAITSTDGTAPADEGAAPRRWRLPAHHVRVCLVESCQGEDGRELTRALEERLGIKLEERTPDGEISLEGLECIGLCGMKEAVLIDDQPVVGRDAVLRAVDDLLR